MSSTGPEYSGIASDTEELLFQDKGQSSVKAALINGFVLFNVILSGIINFGLNGGIGFGVYKNNDAIGLWEEPSTESPVKNSMTIDLCLTCFFVVFFTALFTSGVKNEIKKGTVLPISENYLRKGIWRLFPLHVRSLGYRSLFLALQLTVLYFGFTLLLFSSICAAGSMGGDGKVCQMSKINYCVFKGFWALIIAMLAWPLGYLGCINRTNLPVDVYEVFVERHKPVDEDILK